MTLADYRTADAWHDALELGPALVRMTEELPAHEQTGLVQQLHQLMIELPACVAADLIYGGETRFTPYFKIVAAIELVERIYPALDTARLRIAVEQLAEQLDVSTFGESSLPIEAPEAESSEGQDDQPEETPGVQLDSASPEASAPATYQMTEQAPVSPAEPIHIPLVPPVGPTTVAEASPTRVVNATAFHVQPDRQ